MASILQKPGKGGQIEDLKVSTRRGALQTSKHFRDGLTAPVTEGNLAFMGFPVIHGSHESVARQILALERDTGIGGLLMTFTDYVPDLRSFGKHIMPYLRDACAAQAAL